MNQESIQILNQLNEQHEAANEQLKIVEQQITEIDTFDNELIVLKNQKDGEIIAPLGKSVFAKMKLRENEKFFVEVGAGIFVRKDIDETISVAKEQKEKLESFIEWVVREVALIIKQLEENMKRFPGILNIKKSKQTTHFNVW